MDRTESFNLGAIFVTCFAYTDLLGVKLVKGFSLLDETGCSLTVPSFEKGQCVSENTVLGQNLGGKLGSIMNNQ